MAMGLTAGPPFFRVALRREVVRAWRAMGGTESDVMRWTVWRRRSKAGPGWLMAKMSWRNSNVQPEKPGLDSDGEEWMVSWRRRREIRRGSSGVKVRIHEGRGWEAGGWRVSRALAEVSVLGAGFIGTKWRAALESSPALARRIVLDRLWMRGAAVVLDSWTSVGGACILVATSYSS